MNSFDITRTLMFLPGIIIGLTVHEFSHAWIAQRCGDTTSREQGRVTLNPLRHIDLLGFIMLLVVGFGWAKPVQFNESNLKNPRRDVVKIAIAGPLSNAVTAMVLSIFFVLFFQDHGSGLRLTNSILSEIFSYGILINWGLFIFNLIPLPPLDGSHLLLTYFKKYPVLHNNLYKYGSFLFLGLILGSLMTKINFLPIWPAIEFLGKGFIRLLNYVI